MTDEITDIETGEVTETLPAIQWFGALISAVGMQFPTDTKQEDWEMQGAQIALYERGRQWAIGDWLNFGEQRWGEMYVQATELFHLDKQTLMNLKYVASRFPIERRFPNLSWSQHAEVASMTPDEQMMWLGRSLANGWTRQELRAAIKGGVETDEALILPPEGEEELPFTDGTLPPLEKVWELVFAATKTDQLKTAQSMLLQALNILETLLAKEA